MNGNGKQALWSKPVEARELEPGLFNPKFAHPERPGICQKRECNYPDCDCIERLAWRGY